MAAAFPILKVRSGGPTGHHLTELSLDGQDLLEGGVVALRLELGADKITRATIVLEVQPDVEVPAELLHAATLDEADQDWVEVYRDAGDSWRWRRKAPNHAVISGSQESFSSAYNATRAATRANHGTELRLFDRLIEEKASD